MSNWYVGLGFSVVYAQSVVELRTTVRASGVIERLVLETDDPPSIVVDQITLARELTNYGDQGTPIRMFRRNPLMGEESTDPPVLFNKRVEKGDELVVTVHNHDTSAHVVSGGFLLRVEGSSIPSEPPVEQT